MEIFEIGDEIRSPTMSNWAKIIDKEEVNHLIIKYKIKDNWGEFWDYCFGWEKKINSDDVLKYGEELTYDCFNENNPRECNVFTEIRTIRYEGNIFYHKTVDYETVEFKELTV